MVRHVTPRRLQRRRRRGWRIPDGAVYVGRPTIWGNPFLVTRSSDFHGLPGSWFVRGEDGSIHHPAQDTETDARRTAVELYAREVTEGRHARVGIDRIRAELAGHDLVCWCPDGQPCHADFLLTVANTATARSVTSADASRSSDPGGCPSCGTARADLAAVGQLADDPVASATTAQPRCPTCGAGFDPR